VVASSPPAPAQAGAPAAAPPPVVTQPPPPVVTQPPPPVVTQPPPPVVTQPPPQQAAVTADSTVDGERALTTLQVFADNERGARKAGSIAGMVVGGGFVVAGLVADIEYDEKYGTVLWALGLGAMVGSAIGFFAQGPMEKLAATHASAPAGTLKRIWADAATTARTERHVAGGLGVGLGAVAAGAGVALAAGAGDLSQEAQEDWTIGLIAGGGALIGGGIATMLVETHVEAGYRAAYGHLEPAPIVVGVAPAPGGASFAVSGRF
jgi:hypothetical protein